MGGNVPGLVGGWYASNSNAISVQLNLTATGTELGNVCILIPYYISNKNIYKFMLSHH